MASPYEIEHNIKTDAPKARTRRPSMSSFFNQLSQIETSTLPTPHNNAHSVPTPVDVAATERLLQEQFRALLNTSSDERNQDYLTSLITYLDEQIESPPTKVEGVPQSYLDALERVDKKTLKRSDVCPICNEVFLDDEYPLVVRLPCHKTHVFDLECVGPWLRLQGTCPLDRKKMLEKKEVVKVVDDEEEEYDDMFA
ncbi:hypothetical protein ONS95_005517 [Cadophora gregata]|uniref:uncharacterized protein n=1 Tax=Cadophora gregata TaxID=51156 RepID=UPI0026DA9915|nr:uncharacterized protein ONS95_005517 [Cadophora gregata]KAK0103496.1 hypothetical protein ONS95_005517 [Cadophora gregata]KAK0107688.1 hypothetical protein ONS96_003489 [Cadophora gregata f. sp. sojae]